LNQNNYVGRSNLMLEIGVTKFFVSLSPTFYVIILMT